MQCLICNSPPQGVSGIDHVDSHLCGASGTELQDDDPLPAERLPMFNPSLGSNKGQESQRLNSASGWHCLQAARADRKHLIPHPKEQDIYSFISFTIHFFTLSSLTQLPLLLGLPALRHAEGLSCRSRAFGLKWPHEDGQPFAALLALVRNCLFPCKLSSSRLPELSHPSQLPPKVCNNTAKAYWQCCSSRSKLPPPALGSPRQH